MDLSRFVRGAIDFARPGEQEGMTMGDFAEGKRGSGQGA
jgi:hypothetical protein